MQEWLYPQPALHPGMLPYNEAPDEKEIYGEGNSDCESGDTDSDEEFKDYHIDGYHPVHYG